MRENKITRKIFTLLCVLTLIVGLSILNIPVCAEEIPQDRQLPRLVDDADLLTDSEEQELNTELDEISEKQQCDVVVVTENSLDGKSAQDYADDFFDYNGYGYGDEDSGVLFLIGMDERKWAITTYGYGITAFTDYGLEYMEDEFLSYLSDGEYMEAFSKYATLCDDLLTQARDGHPYDVDCDDDKPDVFTMIFWGVVDLLIGFVVAFIMAQVKKSKLKSVKNQVAANAYKKQGSMKVTTKEDRYINSIVTKRLIPRDDEDHGHSGGGGSTTHVSSSGRSHGGRSGGF